ncbi:putative peroxiredoxin [Peptoniphilus sp. ING2-D1G]|nr:putative peroxiredoxin [Peptoniphilus sp. ING2-D1G]
MEIQERNTSFPIIGRPAPKFTANTTQGVINFPDDYEGKWVILFSHPADFTPVCTTEFMTFSSIYDELQELNTDLVGLSIDSLHSHLGWIEAIKGYTWKDIENPVIQFPVIDDIKMDVANKYGMIQGESDSSAVRAVFFVDPKGIMRTILYYPASLGRNFDEIKRILIGLQKNDSDKVALPADWKPGDPVIVPPPSTAEGIKERMEEAKNNNYTMIDWYLSFKEDK